VIELLDIRKSFGELEVLRGITLSIRPGEVVCIIGPSGSGKSTLLRCINFLEQPTSGRILIDGRQAYYTLVERAGSARPHLAIRPEREIAAVRRRLGMVFQDFALFPHLTALGNVTEGLVFGLGVNRSEARRRGLDMLARVGLADRADH